MKYLKERWYLKDNHIMFKAYKNNSIEFFIPMYYCLILFKICFI